MANTSNWGKIYCITDFGTETKTNQTIVIDSAPACFLKADDYITRVEGIAATTLEASQCVQRYCRDLSGSGSSGWSPVTPSTPTFTGLLDTYTGAAAAYSVRRLSSSYTDSLIRVRRSSDDTEQDIGFDGEGNLDATALTTFVNAEKDIFISDFPNGTTAGSGDGTLQATRTILTAPSSIGGETDALQVECDGTNASYDFRVKFMENGQQHDVSFEYYLPSGNTIVEGVRLVDVSGAGTFTTKGAWTSVTLTDKTATNNILRFFATNSSGSSSIGSGVTESFYIRNLSVSQTTADGFVSKWYDQSGNSQDAQQADSSAQPQIISAGSLITENGKAGVDFDGVDDSLGFASNLNIGGSPSIIGVLNIAAGDIAWRGGGSDYWYFQGSQLLRYRNGDFDASWINSDGLPIVTGSQKLVATYKNSTSVELAVDGTSIATKESGTGTDGAFNHIGSNLLYMDGVWQELIIFTSDQSTNRTGIETNINDHFSIYEP